MIDQPYPGDFMFQLTKHEWKDLKCQFGTSSWGDSRVPRYSIPTGLRPSAQGCDSGATLGQRAKENINPEGVVPIAL
jgi:hypothetical protein